MTTWSVSTNAKCWRTVEVEADSLGEALRLAVEYSEEWARDQDEDLSFGSWQPGDAVAATDLSDQTSPGSSS